MLALKLSCVIVVFLAIFLNARVHGISASTTAFHLPSEEIQTNEPKPKPEGRIAGGEDADIRKFNYQVGLKLWKNSTDTYWCGGSLIARNWVLTAAHCTVGMESITVYLGSAKINETEVQFNISRENFIEHELYDTRFTMNDIALIRIPTVKYTKNIIPVHLPKVGTDDGLVGRLAIVSGWGRLHNNDTGTTNLLQSVMLPIISNDECTETYTNLHIFDGSICVATKDDNIMRSPCQGDSGGPLVIFGTNIQIGVVSFVDKGGCEMGKPAVFARVSYFIDWITANTGINF